MRKTLIALAILGIYAVQFMDLNSTLYFAVTWTSIFFGALALFAKGRV